MRKDILAVLPKHEEYMETLDGRDLYVVDWKDENNGGISFTDYHPGRAAVVEHKIIVRATNHAEILNRQVLRL